MRLLIVGAGGHGKVVAETASACGYDQIDYIDDKSPDAVGTIAELEKLSPTYDGVIISIGNNKIRRELIERLEAVGAPITTLIHPTAFVSSSAEIGIGSVVLPGAVIHTNAKVGKGCIISIGALVDHDCVVGDYCHIDAGAVCRSRSQVLDGLKIEANTVS